MKWTFSPLYLRLLKMSQPRIFSVSEITSSIKGFLEDNIPTIWIQGEISNFKAHYSGHYYFTLKDKGAQISALMWKTRTFELDFDLQDGMLVNALGNIRVYEKGGRYQLDVIRMQPAGLGALQAAFEKLKEKLNAEGLFDEIHKKPFPKFPQIIGIVTSETGAALQDILNILSRRAPHIQIIIRPAKVQGDGAAGEIAKAVDEFNEYGKCDLLIVGRGGGSLEDLWAFNEEETARAIFNSRIPVISAVGHEIDFTIADFTADLRAPTPSAAAELAVPDYVELRDRIISLQDFIINRVWLNIKQLRERIISLLRSYGLRKPEDLIKQHALTVDELDNRLTKAYKNIFNVDKELIKQLNFRLLNLSPKNVLERGYSITYLNDKIVTDAGSVPDEANLVSEVKNGKIFSKVNKVEKGKAE